MTATRTLTNVGKPIRRPDNSLLVGAKISFTLVNSAQRGGVIFSSDGNLVEGDVTTKTDENGEFTVELVPNDALAVATYYLCQIAGVGSFKATLEGGVDPKQWSAFFLTGTTLNPS